MEAFTGLQHADDLADFPTQEDPQVYSRQGELIEYGLLFSHSVLDLAN